MFVTDIYKTVHHLNPTFMTQVFEEKDVLYSFCENNSLALRKAKTSYDIETMRYIGKNYGRQCQRKSKSRNHYRSSN